VVRLEVEVVADAAIVAEYVLETGGVEEVFEVVIGLGYLLGGDLAASPRRRLVVMVHRGGGGLSLRLSETHFRSGAAVQDRVSKDHWCITHAKKKNN
jgi:hypothetical protein